PQHHPHSAFRRRSGMMLVVDRAGTIHCLYSESIDLSALGPLSMRRASHVEPDVSGYWWADLAPVQGPRLGPFACRSAALHAEQTWLEAQLSARSVLPSAR